MKYHSTLIKLTFQNEKLLNIFKTEKIHIYLFISYMNIFLLLFVRNFKNQVESLHFLNFSTTFYFLKMDTFLPIFFLIFS